MVRCHRSGVLDPAQIVVPCCGKSVAAHIDGRPAVGGLRKLEGARRRCRLPPAAAPATCGQQRASLGTWHRHSVLTIGLLCAKTSLSCPLINGQSVARSAIFAKGTLPKCWMHLSCRRFPLPRSQSTAAAPAAGPLLPLLPMLPCLPAAAAPALAAAVFTYPAYLQQQTSFQLPHVTMPAQLAAPAHLSHLLLWRCRPLWLWPTIALPHPLLLLPVQML